MTNDHPPPRNPPARTEAERHRETYRNLMRRIDTGLFSRDDAFTLIHVSLELGRMGYKLTRDESDWQPADAGEEGGDGR